MRFLLAFLFSIVLTVGVEAQTKTFRPGKPVKLNFQLGPDEGDSNDSMCDKSGDTFVTIYDGFSDDRFDRPLLKFGKSGALKAEFPTSRKSLGLADDFFEPSALLSGAGVARLAWSRDGMSLARFTAEGKLESRTKLDGPASPMILPYQLAVFPTGETLVSGLENCRSRRCVSPFKSFTTIYDRSGHLLKRLSIPEDDEIDAAAEIGDSRYATAPMSGNRAVARSKARLGDDGNVYLMRHTSPATVYVISSSGEVVRTLKIQPAWDGWMSMNMQVSGKKLAIEFSKCSPSRCEGSNFSVADAMSGQKLADYQDDPRFGAFACFSAMPERFTFLTISEENVLQVFDAEAR